MTAHTSLAEALAAVQTRLPAIAKGETAKVTSKRTGEKYTYRYADLSDVSEAILPLLGANGLSWITRPTFNAAGKFVLAYELLHITDQSRTGEYPLPDGGTPQEIGSAITYARRYCLCSVTGVAPKDDDDDGAHASRRLADTVADPWDTAKPAPKPQPAAELPKKVQPKQQPNGQPAPMVERGQQKHMFGQFRRLGYDGQEHREIRLAMTEEILGRQVGSSDDLTFNEAAKVIQELDKMIAKADEVTL